MSDPRTGLSYHKLFCSIADALKVNICTITEKRSGRLYYAIKATSRKSKDILRSYFDSYPLLTSKFLDYKSWCNVDNLLKKKNLPKYLQQIQFLKQGMNNSRRSFTWNHLRHI
uniref:Putative laglidadg homing endonuclease n=1 Tax=Ulva flexuosa TaxID=83791 RepID=A0A247ZN72_9CHLO|nr:putative laglidadg homing endonuclease [Ulva flexuosa]AQS79874.1 putative laglidadg homing endonuclease [Ulva flexuosa]